MTQDEQTADRIIIGLIDSLGAQGFKLHAVDDGGEIFQSPADYMAIVHSVSESVLWFRKEGGSSCGVSVVPSLGSACISDYSGLMLFSAMVDTYVDGLPSD